MTSSTLQVERRDTDLLTNSAVNRWDLLTCEYPPEIGGLAGYTQQLADAFSAAGSVVEVWAPGQTGSEVLSPKLAIHRAVGAFRPSDLLRLDSLWKSERVRRNIILQWVPNGYGYDSLNLFFCFWILLQTVRGHALFVMFHEIGYGFFEPKFHLKTAALIHRFMATLLLGCTQSSFASCVAVANRLQRYNLFRRDIHILPVPSNIPKCHNPELVSSIRARFASGDDVLIGHFGLFSPKIETLLTPTLQKVLGANPKVKVLFIGEGSSRYSSALALKSPDLKPRLAHTGSCSPSQVAEFISSCDCIFQPYQDGVSTKRGSAMAALMNSRLLICTESGETEEVWKNTQAVHLIRGKNTDEMAHELTTVIRSPARLTDGCGAALAFYQENFSIEKTLSALKQYASSTSL